MDKVNIGKNLKTLRMNYGITQAELAESIDVTTDHVDHVENGYNGLSLLRLLKICDALKVTPNDIMAGEYKAETKDIDNTLSLDNMKPEDSVLINKLSCYLKSKP